MSRVAAEIFALSLFEVAVEQDVYDQVGEDLDVLRRLIDVEPLLLTYLGSPCFSLSQKHGFVIRVFGTEISSLVRRFLAILLERGRTQLLPEIVACYQIHWDRRRGIKPVQVTVAQALDASRIEKLTHEVSQALQSPVRLEFDVDPTLLGGIVFRSEDQLVDNSLRGRLSRATQLLNERMRSEFRVQS